MDYSLPGSSVHGVVFSRQEYWSRFPFPPPRDFPNPGIGPLSPALMGRFFTTEPSGKPLKCYKQNEMLIHRVGAPSKIYNEKWISILDKGHE